jgi:hypothetical protein
MPSPNDIRKTFVGPRPAASQSNPYDGQYLRLLFNLFCEDKFTQDMNWDLHAMSVVFNNHADQWKPVFFFLNIPAFQYRNSATCTEADNVMRRLLSEADTPIGVLHGLCVSGTRIAFYSQQRKCVTFDFNLMDEDGAARPLEVVKEIKGMCRKLVGDLNVLDLEVPMC